MTTTEISALVAELRRHRNLDSYKRDCQYCMMCGEDWPCPGIRAADALALLVAVVEAANFYVGSLNSNRETSAYAAVHKALTALAEAKL